MDSAETYRKIVKDVILKYADCIPSHGDIRLDPIFDSDNDRYALVQVGWDRGRRVRGLLLYVTLKQGRICIEYDGMERGIVDDLTSKGIPEDQIELAFMSEAAV